MFCICKHQSESHAFSCIRFPPVDPMLLLAIWTGSAGKEFLFLFESSPLVSTDTRYLSGPKCDFETLHVI